MNQSEMEAILKLYEAHFDPAAYQGAVDRFGSGFQGVRLGLQIEETAPRRFCLDSVFANNDERAFSDYIDVAHLNPMVTPAIVDLMRSGRLFRSEPTISREEIKRSEFFDVYLRPRDRMDSAIAFNVFTGPGTTAMFTATIPEALSEDDRSDLAASIDRVRPYVQRSFRMVRDLMQRTAVAQTGDIIDRVCTPVAVFDAAHQLIAQNAKAEAMFRSGGELSVSRRGTLIAREKRSSDHLYAAAGKVMSDSLPVGPVRIVRPAQVPLILYFVPAGGAGRLNPIIEPFKEGFPAYLLYVLDPEDVDPAPMDILTSALGLTPAEAQLAESLHRGSTVREAAEQSSTAYATARNHLTAITRKLNLSRQSELTGLLARIMARVPR